MFSNELTCNIIEYLNNNINKEITIEELSMLFFFNHTYIMKRFKKDLNITIHEYINTIRIYNSLAYYRDDNYIMSIAFKNGFNSLEYYSEMFKKVVGVSPIIYRKFLTHQTITKEEEIKIQYNVSRIRDIKIKALNYLNHRKTNAKSYVKRLY